MTFALTRDIAMAMQIWKPKAEPLVEPDVPEIPVAEPILSDRTVTAPKSHDERGSGNPEGTILW